MIYGKGDFAICLWGGFRVEEKERMKKGRVGNENVEN